MNVNSQFYFARRAVPLLKQSVQGPCLIATGAMSGKPGRGFHTLYASSNAAVVALMQALAMELGPHGIRVNAILPGLIVTLDDVAALVLFLCSPAARHLTGQVVRIDGHAEAS